MAIYWNPTTVWGPLGVAFPAAIAQTSGVAKKLAPVRTGELRRSIGFNTVGFQGYIYATARHARAQEEGTAPHTISVKNKKALANRKMGFGPVKGPVNHPGNPGIHYIWNAVVRSFKPLFITAGKAAFKG